ncbi:MAG TPA: gluconeogenesis factor YvcK family protein [Acidimicrobiales bacterium]|nr:gluconeogenesis factor YvcK family protein [Acidimicrobiales bacterium]
MISRSERRAPKVVAIGGGHGLAQTLLAAREYAGELTAVVSVADDGGSSGRLRELLGIPAPGDLRRCIGALLPEQSALAQALEHRFASGELAGHAFGNLLIAALASTTGDFVAGVEEAARVLKTVGRVLPATEVPVVLKAQAASGELIGQVRVSKAEEIATVSLVPPDAAPPPAVLRAIAEADQIVLGPGSLFTSVLAACVVPGIREGLRSARATRVYVANLREQVPETAGFDVAGLLASLRSHGVPVDVVVADRAALPIGELPADVRLVIADVAADGFREHDPKRLGAQLAPLVPEDVCGSLGE